MKWNEAIRILGVCEKDLRRLVAEAAGDGDYGEVMRLAALAKAVAALGAEGRPQAAAAPAAKAAGSDKPATGGRRGKAEEYPRFYRRGDELVKVGWSKKDRAEYHHRAPRRAVDATAVAVRAVGGKGGLFNGGALLPVKDPAGGPAVPDYQAYVALAWLKELGVVEQHGRRSGYTLAKDKQIESVVTASWPELAEWRG